MRAKECELAHANQAFNRSLRKRSFTLSVVCWLQDYFTQSMNDFFMHYHAFFIGHSDMV